MPAPPAHSPAGIPDDSRERLRLLWAGLLGVFFAASIVKFGNPVILDDPAIPIRGGVLGDMAPPGHMRYLGLLAIAALGFALGRFPKVPRWVVILPLVWLVWQFVASVGTVNVGLTLATVKHFVGCVLCFFVGLSVLPTLRRPWPFWAGLLFGFVFSLSVGWDQHFRGLDAMRQYFYLYELPKLGRVPEELIKRIESRRIFGTFVYANALAGAILLLLPPLAAFLWQELPRRWTGWARTGAVVLAGAALACLYWTGSKSGWLIALVLLAVCLFQLPWLRRWKVVLVSAAVILGGIAFFVRFAGYFEKGATSVSARFDYWAAAGRAFVANPVFGTGPGTFGVIYGKVKPPEAEMAQLVHNDYLEQASDSGAIGCVAYAAFWIGSVICLYHPSRRTKLGFFVWLGLLGWVLQGFVEFALYIPGSAWPAFALLGWLWAESKGSIKPPLLSLRGTSGERTEGRGTQ